MKQKVATMLRSALAATLVLSLAVPAAAQPSSGSNNTPASGGNRMGEGGAVDRRPDLGAALSGQPSTARPGNAAPAANTATTGSTGTPGTTTTPSR